MGGKGRGKKIKTGGRRKRDEMGSVSSENSQGTSEPKRTDDISRMADMTEDDVVIAASEKTTNGMETRPYPQDPALAAIWEAVVRIEANTYLLVREHKELKIICEELERSLQFTQAEVDDIKKENQNLKEKMQSLNETTSELERKVNVLENNLQISIEQGNNLEKKLKDTITMHDNLEQYSGKFNLEIHGIPEQERENAEGIVLDLAKCLHVNLEPEDIDIAHRMEKGNLRPRPIVVRFTNYYSRNGLYRSRTKLRKVNVGRFIEGADRVYVNENLTALRSELFKKVRDENDHRNWRIWT